MQAAFSQAASNTNDSRTRGITMGYMQDHKAIYQQILSLLEHHLGPNSEIVLHDLTPPYDSTIIDIRNGHITGRKIGDCMTNLGLEVMRGTTQNGDHYNYITYTKPSNTLRSSTMHIRDENGNVVGAICINTDITDTIRMEEYLKSYNGLDGIRKPLWTTTRFFRTASKTFWSI